MELMFRNVSFRFPISFAFPDLRAEPAREVNRLLGRYSQVLEDLQTSQLSKFLVRT